LRAAERECLELAERQHGLASRAQLLAHGMSPDQIHRRVSSGAWTRVRSGVYRLGPVAESYLQRLAAAVLWFGEDAVLSHESAAMLWRLPGFAEEVEVSVGSRSHWKASGMRVHAAPDLLSADIVWRSGLKLTSAARTLFDLAERCSDDELAVAMDDALHRGLVTLGQLKRVWVRLGRRGRAGSVRFSRVLEERTPHAASGESPPETILRRMIQRAGLPAPTPQHVVWLGKSYRIDLAYPKERVAVEVQSEKFHGGRFAVRNDSVRFRRLVRDGWTVLPVTPTEIEEGAGELLEALADELRQGAA
jgi:very-short-patch-repair endonuclease